MLDLASKQERQRLGVHGSFKAEFYRSCASPLFIESDVRQAEVIAAKSGKPVLCIETHQMHLPDPLSARQIARRFRHLPTRMKMALHETSLQQKNTVHRIVGDSTWDRLKKMRANFDA